MPILSGKTITETFLNRVRTTPEAIGFSQKSTNPVDGPIGSWREISFREFYEDCERVALGLALQGVQPGDRVAILARSSYEWAVADFAILGMKATTVPIYPSSTPKEVAYLIQDSDASAVFVEDAVQLAKLTQQLDQIQTVRRTIVFDPAVKWAQSLDSKVISLVDLKSEGATYKKEKPDLFKTNLENVEPTDLFTICYTSGTTGTPKGVMLTHGNAVSVLQDCVTAFGEHIRPERETLLTFLPFSHITGKLELLATFTFGWKLQFAESMDRIPANLLEVRPTILFAVPRIFEKAMSEIEKKAESAPWIQRLLYRRALDSGERYYGRKWKGKEPHYTDRLAYGLYRQTILEKVREAFGGRLRFAICGGAPLSKEIAETFRILGVLILEGYGLTETCAPVTLNTIESHKFGTVGKPLADVEIRIAEDGEICLRSEKLFKGYWKMEEETKAALQDGWFHTGDIGFVDPQGFLHITDRKKDLIVTSGAKNIAPQKIENRLKTICPLISEVVVIGDRKKYLTALVTLDRKALKKFALEEAILYSNSKDLTHHAKVQSAIQFAVEELNRELAQFETLKKFLILPGEFSVEGGELSPSLKVKRPVIARKYRTEIESLYSGS